MDKHLDMFEAIAPSVCNKPIEMSHTKCFGIFGLNNPLCRDYGKCRLYEKTCDQFKYVMHPKNRDSFLRACPGSGKTEVVGMKTAYEIRQWDSAHGGIAVLTFTNNAADVIRERVFQFAGYVGYPHYIGTFDSWVHGYLANPFAYILTGYSGSVGDRRLRVVDASNREEWLNAYKSKTPFVTIRKRKKGKSNEGHYSTDDLMAMPIFANNFWYDPEISMFQIRRPFADTYDFMDHKSYYSSEGFQKYLADKKWLFLDIFEQDLIKCKKLFWKAGFVNYQDVECLSLMLLLRKRAIRSRFSQRFPIIIIDECQDLSWIQLRILELLQKQGSRLHLVGDLNQAIYAFKKVEPENVRRFVNDGEFQNLTLQENFRSVQSIVDLCAKLVNQDKVIGVPKEREEPACVYFDYDPDYISQIAVRFEAYLLSRSIDPSMSAILARGRSTVNRLRPAATEIPSNLSIAFATAVYLWSSAGSQGMDEALKCVGKFISAKLFPDQTVDSRQHYRPELVESALQWRLKLASILDECGRSQCVSNLAQTWTKWVKDVRTILEKIVIGVLNEILPDNHTRFKFSVPKGKSSANVIDTLETASVGTRAGIRVTTIHKAKGETLDAVLVVSSPTQKGDGGHWRQWIDDAGGDGEHARFAYVASSRPRKLLAWAIPHGDGSIEEDLRHLGFTPVKQ